MDLRPRFGRTKRRKPDPSRFWYYLRLVLSGISMTTGMLLVILSASELLVFFIDRVVLKNDNYLDWGRAPLIILISSVPFFLIYLIMNLQRFRITNFLLKKFKTSKPPERIETIDLD
ncbi:MAG: hypothetical protein JXA22_08285 [Candidatus Thermoplasmatota archaeon]|nr:hypothetical protein [Candidatus Thermoplasmatota archaeon]